MKIKHPTTEVTVKLADWEVKRLIKASEEVAKMYELGLNEDGVRWKIGDHKMPVISGNTFLFLLDLAKALKESK